VRWHKRTRAILRNLAAAFLFAVPFPLFKLCWGSTRPTRFINEHDFMGKNSHLRAVDDLDQNANIYFSIPRSRFVNGNLQNFSPPREFTSCDLQEILSSNRFYLILPMNVTSAFFQRLIRCRLCARK